MRFAFRTHLQHSTWAEIRDVWLAADERPVFESGWVADHFYPTKSDSSGPIFESWVTLTTLGAITNRLRVGLLVSANPYRHPALVANMAATLDVLTGGRLELGLGAGWSDEEAEAYGLPLGSLTERFDAFEEALEVITSLLSQETTTFSGTYYQLTDARCEPKGLQTPHPPICIGGAGERRALRAVARWAQHWNYRGGSLTELERKREVLARHCADIGRDPSEIRQSMQLSWNGEDPGELRAKAESYLEAGLDLAILTSPMPHRPKVIEAAADVFEDLAG